MHWFEKWTEAMRYLITTTSLTDIQHFTHWELLRSFSSWSAVNNCQTISENVIFLVTFPVDFILFIYIFIYLSISLSIYLHMFIFLL